MDFPSKQDLLDTHKLIKPHIVETPLLESELINKALGVRVLFKCENFQKGGAFKARGACNAIKLLPEVERQKGVCTHSSGNHATAVALMGQLLGTKTYIVMPNNAPQVKIDLVKLYNGEIHFSGPTQDDRENLLEKVHSQTQATIIPPYNHWDVISGQATSAMEIYQLHQNIDYLIVPIGGGGLCSGSLLATHYFSPQTKVIGVEPILAADALISIKTGKIEPQMPPVTIADGLRTSLGTLTLPVIKQHIHEIQTVSEEEIVNATFLIWKFLRIFIEASSATVLAALIKNKQKYQNKNVALILSGGNVDLKSLTKYLQLYEAAKL